MFAISAEHASRFENIGSRIKLNVDMIELMDEAYGLISATTSTSFVWWLSFYIYTRYYLCRLIYLVWFYQLTILFFKHLLKSYKFSSDCDGWNWWDAYCFLRILYISELHKYEILYIIQSQLHCINLYWTPILGVCILPWFLC